MGGLIFPVFDPQWWTCGDGFIVLGLFIGAALAGSIIGYVLVWGVEKVLAKLGRGKES